MSRSWKILFALATMIPAPAAAQTADGVADADRAIAEKMMSAGRITPDNSRSNCFRTVKQGEIVVCAPDQNEQRVPSTTESDPNSPQALRDGRLHTPDVAGNGIFKGKATRTFGHIVAPYMIDLSSIPQAPVGSDADKIAKGELRGR